MAAAVRAASTLRFASGPAGLSGKPALEVGIGPLDDELGATGTDGGIGTGAGIGATVGTCAAGPINATGLAETEGEVIGATGALLAGPFRRPTE
jgi:hypothetical protein